MRTFTNTKLLVATATLLALASMAFGQTKMALAVDTKPSAEAPKAESKADETVVEGVSFKVEDLEKKLSIEVPDFKEALEASKKTLGVEELKAFRRAMKEGGMGYDSPTLRSRATIAVGLKSYEVAIKALNNQAVNMVTLEILSKQIEIAEMREKINFREARWGQNFVVKQQEMAAYQISVADIQLYSRAMNFMARHYELSDPADPRPVLISEKRLPGFFLNDAGKKLLRKK
jgi:hypothetical protein